MTTSVDCPPISNKNVYDNTLIVFISDNGPEGNAMKMDAPWDNSTFEDWGKKGTFIQYGSAWAQVSAGPFRMFKGFLSEGGIRSSTRSSPDTGSREAAASRMPSRTSWMFRQRS